MPHKRERRNDLRGGEMSPAADTYKKLLVQDLASHGVEMTPDEFWSLAIDMYGDEESAVLELPSLYCDEHAWAAIRDGLVEEAESEFVQYQQALNLASFEKVMGIA